MPDNVVVLLILLGVAAVVVVCTLIFVVIVDRSVARGRTEERSEREEGAEPTGVESSQDTRPD